MKFQTIDTEYNFIRYKDHPYPSHPAHPFNKMVLAGISLPQYVEDSGEPICRVMDAEMVTSVTGTLPEVSASTDLWVGHNIKADYVQMFHLAEFGTETADSHMEALQSSSLFTAKVWDTMVAEYVLSGQSTRMASLNSLSEKYGGSQKDDEVKKYWDEGMDTSEIPTKILRDYLIDDVKNTTKIFKCQLARAVELDLVNIILVQSEMARVLALMEVTGFVIDNTMFKKGRTNAVVKVERLKGRVCNTFISSCKEHYGLSSLVPVVNAGIEALNLARKKGTILKLKEDHDTVQGLYEAIFSAIQSPKRLLDLLNAGALQIDVPVEVQYKNGSTKQSVIPIILDNPTLGGADLENTAEATLTNFANSDDLRPSCDLIKDLLLLRATSKDISSFYDGYEAAKIQVRGDDKVFPQYNNAVTATGRLSSSKPNIQQLPSADRSEIRKALGPAELFYSRRMAEIDYSQLEMVGYACATNDRALILDLKKKVDIHARTALQAWGDKDRRKSAKAINFGLIYGGGAKGIAAGMNMDPREVHKVQKAFRAMYPEAYKATRERVDYVQGMAEFEGEYGENGKGLRVPLRTARVKAGPLNRLYTFQGRAYTEDGGPAFTEICNYPVQGFATGDLVPTMIVEVYNQMFESLKTGKLSLHATIHDSLIISSDYEPELNAVNEVMNDVERVMRRMYGVELPVVPETEMKVGFDMTFVDNVPF